MLKFVQGTNFRNFSHFEIEPSFSFNLIHGNNGSGKTSLLEAIYYLGVGKSFRTHRSQIVVNNQASQFTLFTRFNNDLNSIGLERHRDGTLKNKIDGQVVASSADLAKALPILLINQDSFCLLEGSPKERRQFLDWCMFHVEHEFHSLWKQNQQLLTQRNALLRTQPSARDVAPWDEALIKVTLALNQLRLIHLKLFEPLFQQVSAFLLPEKSVAMEYYPGWNTDYSYEEALKRSFGRDLQLGSTQVGTHRADIRLKTASGYVIDTFSRGEQKLLIYSLKLAQGLLLRQQKERPCCYLIDDLLAELDIRHQQQVLRFLIDLESQVFITATHWSHLEAALTNLPGKMFHVEQGVVREHESVKIF